MPPKSNKNISLAELDKKYVWHPFTQMKDWVRSDPVVLVRGKGAVLWDAEGRSYLDANSSIWTNLHGHNHPKINRAIEAQLRKVAHTSALGFANEPASLLAEALVESANPPSLARPGSPSSFKPLSKVFYSDDGSTAMEAALKLAYEFAKRVRRVKKPRFLSLESAYHGDTVGAVSLGHVDLFHRAYSGLLFQADKVMAPYCYRCPYNRARPERADAREYRQCQWECVGEVEQRFEKEKRKEGYAAMVVEPVIQGVAGMVAQPRGWLKRVDEIVRNHGAQLIADEVMTGFGRTGSLFACHTEGVQPDYMALAKGMTGGYVPMAATLVTEEVYRAFLGEYEEFKTFFHGHSFTSNQIGAAAALSSLNLLNREGAQEKRHRVAQTFHSELQTLWRKRVVGDIRREGLVAGIELVRDWETKTPFKLEEKAGIRVCDAMKRHGVLTRPIGNLIVLMPPYCSTRSQVRTMVAALHAAIDDVFGAAYSATPA